jgi:hypothetical protein
MDSADLHMKFLVLRNDFTACQARSRQTGEKQVELLQTIQKEIVRFETDVSKKMVELKRDVHTILEHLTKPKKKKRRATA